MMRGGIPTDPATYAAMAPRCMVPASVYPTLHTPESCSNDAHYRAPVPVLSHCDGCNDDRPDVRAVGRDAEGEADGPDLCGECREDLRK